MQLMVTSINPCILAPTLTSARIRISCFAISCLLMGLGDLPTSPWQADPDLHLQLLLLQPHSTQLLKRSREDLKDKMAWLGLGVFFGGVITGVPIVTGVAEGVQHQKEQNKEAANQTRMIKFFMDCFCDNDEINGYTVVLKHDKVCLSILSARLNSAC